MSWNITSAGPATEVQEKFRRKVEQNLQHMSEAGKSILHAHVQAVTELCDKNPGSTIVVESQGHIDNTNGGTANLTLRKLFD